MLFLVRYALVLLNVSDYGVMKHPWTRGDRYFDIAIDDLDFRYNGAGGAVTPCDRWENRLATPAVARKHID